MKCPYCGHQDDKVLDSRSAQDGEAIRRRRECLSCGQRFTTYEQIEDLRVMVVKRDKGREQFDRSKVLRGMIVACEKRPVAMDTLEEIADDITRRIHSLGEKEVGSEVVGEMVMEALRNVDPVAYVRFASVYRKFEDVGQFREILDVFGRRSGKKSQEEEVEEGC